MASGWRKVALVSMFAPPTFAFNTSSLQVAVSAFCDDELAAEAVYGPISYWDTSEVTDMSTLFMQPKQNGDGYCSSASTFNGAISCWDVGKVTDMQNLFFGCSSFNQPIIAWDVSKVTSMAGMFYGNAAFDQPLAWDVGAVTSMEGMFEEASSFDQEILSGWDIS